MTKETTDQKIDKLARAMAQGFESLETKMDKRFEQVDKRFDDMDTRFDRLEFFVNGHERQIEILNDKVNQLAIKVGLKFN